MKHLMQNLNVTRTVTYLAIAVFLGIMTYNVTELKGNHKDFHKTGSIAQIEVM
jgi:hypothetical protein